MKKVNCKADPGSISCWKPDGEACTKVDGWTCPAFPETPGVKCHVGVTGPCTHELIRGECPTHGQVKY